MPWGLLIGGEELYNHHHTYPTSAKLSVRRHEFDLGWAYIRGLELIGLATVRRMPLRLRLGVARSEVDAPMLDAIIANRHEFMARYARRVRRATRAEWLRLRAGGCAAAHLADLRTARCWLHRDVDKIPHHARAQISDAVAQSPVLAEMVVMRE